MRDNAGKRDAAASGIIGINRRYRIINSRPDFLPGCAQTREVEQRLAAIAAEPGKLADDAKGTGVAANALDVLQAAGYVVMDGQVTKASEANPPLGIGR